MSLHCTAGRKERLKDLNLGSPSDVYITLIVYKTMLDCALKQEGGDRLTITVNVGTSHFYILYLFLYPKQSQVAKHTKHELQDQPGVRTHSRILTILFSKLFQ